jgi:uncharacterized protein
VATLQERLHTDLTEAMRSRDELRTATLRMTLAAIRSEEVAGPQARVLDDAAVQAVIRREQKKRREAADAFTDAGRTELAQREAAESEVLAGYLPAQLDDPELDQLVRDAVAKAGATAMGPAMKAANEAVAGRADGARVAAIVRAALAG